MFTDIFIKDLDIVRIIDPNPYPVENLLAEYNAVHIKEYLRDFQEQIRSQNAFIPITFSSISTWPKSTTLSCWNCSLKFGSIPLFIPNGTKRTSDDPEQGIQNLFVRGNFCSFGCALNYLKEVDDPEIKDKRESKILLYYLYEKFTGKDNILTPYPSYRILKEYMGFAGISSSHYISEYRASKTYIGDVFVFI